MPKQKFVYNSGSWSFMAEGYPDREAVQQLLETFLANCPPGARIDGFSVNGMLGQQFEVRANWRVDPPQDVTP